MDESVPQARLGQGQVLFLYRLQADAAEFIKKVLTVAGQEGFNTSCLFHSKYGRKNNMVIRGKQSTLLKNKAGSRHTENVTFSLLLVNGRYLVIQGAVATDIATIFKLKINKCWKYAAEFRLWFIIFKPQYFMSTMCPAPLLLHWDHTPGEVCSLHFLIGSKI